MRLPESPFAREKEALEGARRRKERERRHVEILADLRAKAEAEHSTEAWRRALANHVYQGVSWR